MLLKKALLLILTFLLLSPALGQKEEGYSGWSTKHLPHCEKQPRTAPPQWVITTGGPTNQNYKVGEQKDTDFPFVVPKRSIVQIQPKFQKLFEESRQNEARRLEFVGVRVLSIPPENAKLAEAESGNTKRVAKYSAHSKAQTAKAGDVGYMRFGDLEQIKEQKGFVFAVKAESPLFQFLKSETKSDAFALQLWQEDGKFWVNHCCGDVNGVYVCRDFAIYRVLDGRTGEAIKGVEPMEAQCEGCLLKHLVAMSADFLKPLQGLIDVVKSDSALEKMATFSKLNLVDSRGYVQIPIDPEHRSSDPRPGPFGSLHYTPEKGNADLYMKPESACGFMQVLKAWKEKHCPSGDAGCQVRFGNASHAFNNSDIAKGANYWPHFSHDEGECVDVRPIYKSGCDGDCSFQSKNFQPDKFQKLMELMMQAGAGQCLMNHSGVSKSFKQCQNRSDHDDHLHICFPPRKDGAINEKLMEACQKGVR